MVLLAVMLLALITAPLFGGRLSALEDARLGWGWALALGLGLQILIISVFPDRYLGLHPYLHIGSYLFVGLFVWMNLRILGIFLIGLGGLSNLVAITANGGTMPARAEALRAAGVVQQAGDFQNSGVVDDPKLGFLGDVFAIPESVPILNNVFSVGDVIIAIGTFILIHHLCGSRLTAGLSSWMSRGEAKASITSAPDLTSRVPLVLKPVGVSDDGCAVLLADRDDPDRTFELKIDEDLVGQLQVATDRVHADRASERSRPEVARGRRPAKASP